MTDSYHLFDRRRLRAHRDRAAAGFDQYDFLFRELASRMADRLPDVKRTFPVVLELGAHTGILAEYLGREADIKTFIQTDLSRAMIAGARGTRLVADEEFLPFAANSFDLVMSVFSLHWVNDLPGTL
ncbi:MAG: class I SAM-dependent methyltransferase, partial [Rickettsiales bacterium]|nr:class I SAM-dependent methyltransferase [Rickettsiales bacterium]